VAGYEPLSRAELLVLLAGRDRRIAQLEVENAELARRMARLEQLISRNSGNSSMPPSADDLPGRKAPREQPRRWAGRRRPGKQPGAPGSHLAWSKDPDTTIPHFPEGTCECGAALAEAVGLGVAASHQLVDIPLASAQVIQHDVYAVACAAAGCTGPPRRRERARRAPSPTASICRRDACT
jgi:transposase